MDDALVTTLVRLFVKKVDTHVLQWPTYEDMGVVCHCMRPPCFLACCLLAASAACARGDGPAL